MIKTLTVKEAAAELRKHGMAISDLSLAAGLEQGVYPFGVCIRMERSRVFQIFPVLLRQWIAEREEAE